MSHKRSLFEIHLAVLLFGLAGLFGKWLALSPVIIVLGRVFFASVALALLFLFTKQSLRIYPRKNYLLLFLLGLILSIHWISFFKSIQVSTVAVGLLSYSIFPVFTAFLEPLFFKEKLPEMVGCYNACLPDSSHVGIWNNARDITTRITPKSYSFSDIKLQKLER